MTIFNKSEKLQNINLRFSWLSAYLANSNAIGFFDDNKSAEDFCIPLLNIIYDLELVNLNSVKKNHPAIDLGCSKTKTSIQITSSGTLSKLKNTKQLFDRHQLNKTYNSPWILELSNEKHASHPDVKTLKDIFQAISGLTDEKISRIDEHLNATLRDVKSVLSPQAVPPRNFAIKPSCPYKLPQKDISEFIVKTHILTWDSTATVEQVRADLNDLSVALSEIPYNQRIILFSIMTAGLFEDGEIITLKDYKLQEKLTGSPQEIKDEMDILINRGFAFRHEDTRSYGICYKNRVRYVNYFGFIRGYLEDMNRMFFCEDMILKCDLSFIQ